MSLIIDILKKLEGKGKKPKVHPALLKGADVSSDRKRYVFLAFSILFALSALAAYFVSDKVLSRAVYQEIEVVPAQVAVDKAPKEITFQPRDQVKAEEKLTHEEETPRPKIVKKVQAVVEEEKEEKMKEKEDKPEPKPIRVSEGSGVEKVISDITMERPKPANPAGAGIKPPSGSASEGSFSKFIYLADRAFREGNLPDSMKYYEKALDFKQDRKVAKNLIVVYVKLGLYERALSLLSSMKDEDLAYTYLVELARSGEIERAVKEGERLKGLDRRGKILFALGYVHEISGNLEEALENYKIAYRKNPGDPYIAVNYARLLEATGNLQGAYRVYSSLNFVNLDPKIKSLVRERIGYLRSLGF